MIVLILLIKDVIETYNKVDDLYLVGISSLDILFFVLVDGSFRF